MRIFSTSIFFTRRSATAGQADARARACGCSGQTRDHAALARRDRMHRGEDQPHQDEAEHGPHDQRPIGPAGKSTAPAAEASAAAAQAARRARRRCGPRRSPSGAAVRLAPWPGRPSPSSARRLVAAARPEPQGPLLSANRPRTRPPHPEMMFIDAEYRERPHEKQWQAAARFLCRAHGPSRGPADRPAAR